MVNDVAADRTLRAGPVFWKEGWGAWLSPFRGLVLDDEALHVRKLPAAGFLIPLVSFTVLGFLAGDIIPGVVGALVQLAVVLLGLWIGWKAGFSTAARRFEGLADEDVVASADRRIPLEHLTLSEVRIDGGMFSGSHIEIVVDGETVRLEADSADLEDLASRIRGERGPNADPARGRGSRGSASAPA